MHFEQSSLEQSQQINEQSSHNTVLHFLHFNKFSIGTILLQIGHIAFISNWELEQSEQISGIFLLL